MSAPADSQPPARPSTSWVSVPPLVKQRDQRAARSLVVSFWLWLVAALAATATAAVALTEYDRVHALLYDVAREQDKAADTATLNDVATLGIVVLVGGGVAVTLLQLIFAAAMRGGRGWVRVVLVVLGLGTVVYGLVLIETLTAEVVGDLVATVRVGLGIYIALVLSATVAMFGKRSTDSPSASQPE